MDKVQLEIIGLSYSQTQSGAYVLLLSEKDGTRKLPIIIGSYEAQAIAIELEKMVPNRPLTHDLFKTIATSFDINLTEVFINELNEGIFHAKLVFQQEGRIFMIDARTSDAIAIAVRFKCPIFTLEKIMDSAGILMEDAEETGSDITKIPEVETSKSSDSDHSDMSLEQLQELLDKSLENEEYETASKIRDEINRRNAQQ
jgi:uncharacterized protein